MIYARRVRELAAMIGRREAHASGRRGIILTHSLPARSYAQRFQTAIKMIPFCAAWRESFTRWLFEGSARGGALSRTAPSFGEWLTFGVQDGKFATTRLTKAAASQLHSKFALRHTLAGLCCLQSRDARVSRLWIAAKCLSSFMAHQNRFKQWLLKWLLSRSGWKENRQIDVPWNDFDEFECFPLAKEALGKYYGLNINGKGLYGRGGVCDIHIDPSVAKGMGLEINRLKQKFSAVYFPLGETHEGRCILLLREAGDVYLWGDMARPYFLGKSFEDALLRLLLLGKWA
jgi:hypothetical protein